jgi:1,2-diacylglycerol 3-alpha-glucosyltransferase
MKIFFLCSGLGWIKRGFESFTQECFTVIKNYSDFDVNLFKGGGKSYANEFVLWNTRREGILAKIIARLSGKSSYFVEQATFTSLLIRYLIFQKPEVIFFSDGNIGNILWHFRRKSGMGYRLLFSNGGPLSPPFPRWDFVHQVAPMHALEALRAGHNPERQMTIPYGFHFRTHALPSPDEIRALRVRLNLPPDRKVVVSVGTLNHTHKRMGYVIDEIATMPRPAPYLLLLGQSDAETVDLKKRAAALLGEGNFAFRCVSSEEVPDFLNCSDIFVLASLVEGFGRVVVEACGSGIPSIVHDSPLMRYVLGNQGNYADLTKSGALSGSITGLINMSPTNSEREMIRSSVRNRFSWEVLLPEYLQMFHACMKINV